MKHRPGKFHRDDDGRLYVFCSCGAYLAEAGVSSAGQESGNHEERVNALVAVIQDHVATEGAVEPPARRL